MNIYMYSDLVYIYIHSDLILGISIMGIYSGITNVWWYGIYIYTDLIRILLDY